MQKINSKQKRHLKLMLYLYTLFFFILSFSVIAMPIAVNLVDTTKLWLYIAGTMFWAGIIGIMIMFNCINYSRKHSNSFNQSYPNFKKMGLIHFFQNVRASIADTTMFISIVGFVFAKIWIDNIIIQFIFLSLFLFSFGMHCILNGINYNYINYIVRGQKDYE